MGTALVSTADHDTIRLLTLQRPEALNAMNIALLASLLDAVAAAAVDTDVRVLVLSGAGSSFSAGADLREPLDEEGRQRRMELFCAVYETVGGFPKPTIAAVQGNCVGGGAEVAAACDLRVADTTARFRFPGAAVGLPVGAAKLVGLVGLGAAKDLVFTTRTVDAGEAAQLGLAQRVVADGDAVAAALELAGDIAANQPDAVTYLKREFTRFSGLTDRIAAENDVLRALAGAGGDYTALAPADGGVGGYAAPHMG